MFNQKIANPIGNSIEEFASSTNTFLKTKVQHSDPIQTIADACLAPLRKLSTTGATVQIESDTKSVYVLPKKAPHPVAKVGCALLSPLTVIGSALKPFALLSSSNRKKLKLLIESKKHVPPTPAVEITKVVSIDENDPLTDHSLLIHLLDHLETKEKGILTCVSKTWYHHSKEPFLNERLPLILKTFFSPEEVLTLPALAVSGYRAGIEKRSDYPDRPLIQLSNAQRLSHLVLQFQSEIPRVPICRFIDPWGRIGFVISYNFRLPNFRNPDSPREGIGRLVLQEESVNGPWIIHCLYDEHGAVIDFDTKTFYTANIALLFSKGWNDDEQSDGWKFLKRLISGEPCGLGHFPHDQLDQISETATTFKNDDGEDSPFVQIL